MKSTATVQLFLYYTLKNLHYISVHTLCEPH